MSRWITKAGLVAAVAGLALAAPTAHAGVLPALKNDPVYNPETGNYIWTYAVELTSGSTLTPNTSFFTLYDFDGFVGVVSTPANPLVSFGVTVNDPNGTPPGFAVIENPSIPDLTFTYTGDVALANPSAAEDGTGGSVPLGDIVLESKYGEVKLSDEFTFTSKTFLTINGQVEINFVPLAQPLAGSNQGSQVPEPATLTLVGLGLPALLAYRRRNKTAQ